MRKARTRNTASPTTVSLGVCPGLWKTQCRTLPRRVHLPESREDEETTGGCDRRSALLPGFVPQVLDREQTSTESGQTHRIDVVLTEFVTR